MINSRSPDENRDADRSVESDPEQIPRRAGRRPVRAVRERVPARPLGRVRAKAHHQRAARAGAGEPEVQAGAAAAAGSRMSLAGRHVVLGVSGGIACYKSCSLARRLTEHGLTVDVVLTAAATEFIRPLTFEALTGRPVLTSLWERERALAHIGLAKQPELVIVAPATAQLIARAAMGMADDLLTAILLARSGPVLAAPAMNDAMYAHPATQTNLQTLAARGWELIGPERGALAEGPSERPGRMSEPETIVAAVLRRLGVESRWTGRKVVVSAGPTREHLDPVRVLTNPSSGRMGFALAEAARDRGARVTLVLGPTPLVPPGGVDVVRVETTEQMQQAIQSAISGADALFMAA